MKLLILLAGMGLGYFSARAHNVQAVARLAALEAAMQVCDTEVLKAQKELDAAREAYWGAQTP